MGVETSKIPDIYAGLYLGGTLKPLRKGAEKGKQGPVYLPRPRALEESDIESAQKLFDGNLNGNTLSGEVFDEEWVGAFRWLTKAIQCAHLLPGIRHAVLIMLGKDQTYWYGRRREVLANGLLRNLREAASISTTQYSPPFDAFAERAGLVPVIQKYADWQPSGEFGFKDTGVSDNLVNKNVVAFLGYSRNQLVSAASLVLLGYCIAEKFEQTISMLVMKSRAQYHPAPVKSYDRTEQKVLTEYADNFEYPEADKANYVMDVLRGSVIFKEVEQLQQFLEQLCTGADVQLSQAQRIKTSNTNLRMFLVNLIFKPQNEKGVPLTYRELGEAFIYNRAELFSTHGGFYTKQACDTLMDERLHDKPVRMIVELQLYMDFYFKYRSLTHLWYKIQRAPSLHHLSRDCEYDANRSSDKTPLKHSSIPRKLLTFTSQ
eukprot:m.75393 g.75393  ORF g.75393 m.75393 type:complete len:431 (-) comp12499_c0_seq2:165-1457(-)